MEGLINVMFFPTLGALVHIVCPFLSNYVKLETRFASNHPKLLNCLIFITLAHYCGIKRDRELGRGITR